MKLSKVSKGERIPMETEEGCYVRRETPEDGLSISYKGRSLYVPGSMLEEVAVELRKRYRRADGAQRAREAASAACKKTNGTA